jgi:hypothetical protein
MVTKLADYRRNCYPLALDLTSRSRFLQYFQEADQRPRSVHSRGYRHDLGFLCNRMQGPRGPFDAHQRRRHTAQFLGTYIDIVVVGNQIEEYCLWYVVPVRPLPAKVCHPCGPRYRLERSTNNMNRRTLLYRSRSALIRVLSLLMGQADDERAPTAQTATHEALLLVAVVP